MTISDILRAEEAAAVAGVPRKPGSTFLALVHESENPHVFMYAVSVRNTHGILDLTAGRLPEGYEYVTLIRWCDAEITVQ